MTDLTDKWEKGELIEGKKYYCESKNIADIFTAECHNKGQGDEWWALKCGKYCFNNVHHKNSIKVLAQVPSCEEFDNITKCYLCAHKKAARLEKENTKLKELLVECREALKLVAGETIYFPHIVDECIDKINQALGEE